MSIKKSCYVVDAKLSFLWKMIRAAIKADPETKRQAYISSLNNLFRLFFHDAPAHALLHSPAHASVPTLLPNPFAVLVSDTLPHYAPQLIPCRPSLQNPCANHNGSDHHELTMPSQ